jgi:hypothetical protein
MKEVNRNKLENDDYYQPIIFKTKSPAMALSRDRAIATTGISCDYRDICRSSTKDIYFYSILKNKPRTRKNDNILLLLAINFIYLTNIIVRMRA